MNRKPIARYRRRLVSVTQTVRGEDENERCRPTLVVINTVSVLSMTKISAVFLQAVVVFHSTADAAL